jgi:hypothetical protein
MLIQTFNNLFISIKNAHYFIYGYMLYNIMLQCYIIIVVYDL